jgi:hypothetical protein
MVVARVACAVPIREAIDVPNRPNTGGKMIKRLTLACCTLFVLILGSVLATYFWEVLRTYASASMVMLLLLFLLIVIIWQSASEHGSLWTESATD